MIIRSPYPEFAVPKASLTSLLYERSALWGGKAAIIDGASGRIRTYAQFWQEVRSLAAGLARNGFVKGDVFAIFSPNMPEYAIAFHAVSLLGGTITTVNPLNTIKELADQLKDARAKYLFTVPALMEKAVSAAHMSNIPSIIVAGKSEEAISYETLLQTNGNVPEITIQPDEDVLALPYSSGTTGLSKGVMLTHSNIVSNVIQIATAGVVHENDVLVCVLPLFHIYGLVVILNEALYQGATVVMMPHYDFLELLGIIQRYEVTLAPLVPPIVLSLSKNPEVDRFDLTKMKTIFSAAAPLGEVLTRECISRIGCVVKQGYGMTEASPATHMTPDDPGKTKAGSVGVCVANTECRIVDVGTGKDLGRGKEGEIWIRGPQIMKGYLNRPDATQLTILPGGWLRTGDIGLADNEGYFFIVDRLKELIKYKGFQVAPAELEAVLVSHPLVADAAVIPVADAEAGEVPKAFIVLRSPVAPEELLAFVAERVAPYKKIRKIEILERIPKSPSGKILRRLLIEKERSELPS